MERIGIYGGSFNPPHIGHIQAAEQAVRMLNLDRLLLIPAGIAPHKQLTGSEIVSPQQRLEMLHIAAEGLDRVEVSDLEVNREGPSYTYETVEQLHEKYPGSQLILIMGTDMFLSFLQWKQPERITKYASLAVLYRGESGEREAIDAQIACMAQMGIRAEAVCNAVTAISSTDLRRMLVFRCASPMLPKGVEAYIREKGLYGTDRDYRNLPADQLEAVVTGLLKPNRVAHVLGCRDTSEELARRWGADVTDASRAGMLHDITKALDGPLQLTLCSEYGTILDEFSSQNPKTLHALTGSLVAERIFGERETVVEAIRSHTTGKANMNLLQKIIYVADYMEPNRAFPGVEKLRELAFSDIDAALKLGLQMTLDMLQAQKREISPESREALAYLQAQGK